MPEIPGLFVTPHAIEQFQHRIANLPEAVVRKIIVEGITQATNCVVLPDENTLRVRTRRPYPYEFRAYCVFDHDRGHPVVTTIVRGDSNVTRKQRRRTPNQVEGKPPVPGPAPESTDTTTEGGQ